MIIIQSAEEKQLI